MTTTAPVLHAAGGSGAPVVLVHGFGADRMSWIGNQTELAKVASVFTLDLPGHGGQPLAGDGSPGALAAALAASVDQAGIGPAHIVGHSLGGAVAIALTAERPDLVRSLALIAPAGLGQPVEPAFLADFPKLDTPEAATTLLQRLVSRPRLINRFMVALVLEQLAMPGARDRLAAIAATLGDINARIAPERDAIAATDLPRLVIWGDADPIVPLDRDRLDTFGGEQMIVEGAAHLPHVESAVRVNQRLAAWLAERAIPEPAA